MPRETAAHAPQPDALAGAANPAWAGDRWAVGRVFGPFSTPLAAVALLLAWALGTRRYLMDGSFWESEAFIAYNLLVIEPSALFGPLATDHSFPRLYLWIIAQAMHLFGYETLVLRALPWFFFLVSMALLVWVLGQRFRDRPGLFATALILALAVPVQFAYAAMLKQYTLELALTLALIAVPDKRLDDLLREGRRRFRLWLFVLPCLLSYGYAIVLIARIAGWWGHAALQRRFAVDLRSALLAGLTTLVALGVLWWTELRHTAGADALFQFWTKCIVGAGPAGAGDLFGQLLTGWWTRPSGWGNTETLLAWPGQPVLLALWGLGVVSAVLRGLGRERPGNDAGAQAWGSRSLACAAIPPGLFLASLLFGYPICANNLTLFALVPIVCVVVEGMGLALRGIEAWAGRRTGQAFQAAVVLVLLPVLAGNVAYQWRTPPAADVRPLLPAIEKHGDLPLAVAACSRAQVETLPEWQGRDDIHYFNPNVRDFTRGRLPSEPRFLMISASSVFLCPWFLKQMRDRGGKVRTIASFPRSASLWLVDYPFDAPREWPLPNSGKATAR